MHLMPKKEIADKFHHTAAKAALRRKKQFEHTLEQTRGQIMTLESEIYSIEAANINKETLDAMKNASSAMKQIHGGLTIDKVDQTMYVESRNYPRTIVGGMANIDQGRATRAACYRRRNWRSYYAIHRQHRLGRIRVG